jgi:tetratricopeptide (TPR) repeat protein
MTARSLAILIAAASMCLTGCTAAPRPTDSIRESGTHRYKFGDYEGARDEFAEIVARYPGDWQAQYMLGLCMLKTGELPAARRALETAYTHKPQNQDVADALAEVMLAQGDESRLFAFLRERASRTQRLEAYLQLAKYTAELNDPDSAQAAINMAIQIDNGRSTEPYLEAARLAERLGQMDEAVRRLKQAYGINHNDFRVRQRLKALGEDPEKTSPLPPGK